MDKADKLARVWLSNKKLHDLIELATSLDSASLFKLVDALLQEYERRLNKSVLLRPKGKKWVVGLKIETMPEKED